MRNDSSWRLYLKPYRLTLSPTSPEFREVDDRFVVNTVDVSLALADKTTVSKHVDMSVVRAKTVVSTIILAVFNWNARHPQRQIAKLNLYCSQYGQHIEVVFNVPSGEAWHMTTRQALRLLANSKTISRASVKVSIALAVGVLIGYLWSSL